MVSQLRHRSRILLGDCGGLHHPDRLRPRQLRVRLQEDVHHERRTGGPAPRKRRFHRLADVSLRQENCQAWMCILPENPLEVETFPLS